MLSYHLVYFLFIPFFITDLALAACFSPSGTRGQMQYISGEYKFCNNTNWISLSVTNLGTSCSVSGQWQRSGTDAVFCNGANWISMVSSVTDGTCPITSVGTIQFDVPNLRLEWCDGINWKLMQPDVCLGNPTPGTICLSGTIFLGTLAGNKYMTHPGGCAEIPVGQKIGSGINSFPSGDFTPTCSGVDALRKTWNDGSTNYYNIPDLIDYTTTLGTGMGSINVDSNFGSINTANIISITSAAEGGYHAAARYCDQLVYGGYSDWYLPNRTELNLIWESGVSIPGINTGSYYWSSTEKDNYDVWVQRFSDGLQSYDIKHVDYYFRCIRRF